jgi:hypothetical protein
MMHDHTDKQMYVICKSSLMTYWGFPRQQGQTHHRLPSALPQRAAAATYMEKRRILP